MSKKAVKLGIFGFGCVGQGLHAVLANTPGIKAQAVKICVKNRDKPRSLPPEIFVYDKEEILNDPEINVVVELIDDAEEALNIVTQAMKLGKAVITANKKMVAENIGLLHQLQETYRVPLLYEGAVCASIPIIRNLEEYYDNDLVNAVYGVFNGSTNYILTKIFEEGLTFETALRQAQESGFAESDPTLDVEGYDAKYKLAIIIAHAYGVFVQPEQVYNYGIGRISAFDIRLATEKGYKIKLVARCLRYGPMIYGLVMPQFVPASSPLTYIENEFNGVVVEGAFSEHQVFIGKGAGSYPTGSAVLSDISALTHNYRYEYKKRVQGEGLAYSANTNVKVYVSFEQGVEVATEDFESIEEQYSSHGHSYIIGQLSLKALQASAWHDNSRVSIIMTTDNGLSPMQEVEENNQKAFEVAHNK